MGLASKDSVKEALQKRAGKKSNVTILTYQETYRELLKSAQQLSSSRAGAKRVDVIMMLTVELSWFVFEDLKVLGVVGSDSRHFRNPIVH